MDMQVTDDDSGSALHHLAAECANAFNEVSRLSQLQSCFVQREFAGKQFRETRERYEQWSNNYGASKLPQDDASLANLSESLFLVRDALGHILKDLRETLQLGKRMLNWYL
jgi:hypothetical protein